MLKTGYFNVGKIDTNLQIKETKKSSQASRQKNV